MAVYTRNNDNIAGWFNQQAANRLAYNDRQAQYRKGIADALGTIASGAIDFAHAMSRKGDYDPEKLRTKIDELRAKISETKTRIAEIDMEIEKIQAQEKTIEQMDSYGTSEEEKKQGYSLTDGRQRASEWMNGYHPNNATRSYVPAQDLNNNGGLL